MKQTISSTFSTTVKLNLFVTAIVSLTEQELNFSRDDFISYFDLKCSTTYSIDSSPLEICSSASCISSSLCDANDVALVALSGEDFIEFITGWFAGQDGFTESY